jgi:hypothetical protein
MIFSASSRERYSRSLSSTESSLHVVSPPEPACKHKSVSATTSGKIAGGDRYRSHCAKRNTDSPKERNNKKACLVTPRSMLERKYHHMLVQVDTNDCLGTACATDVAEDDTDDLKTYVHSFSRLCSTAEKLDSYRYLLSEVSLEFQSTKDYLAKTCILPIVAMTKTYQHSVIKTRSLIYSQGFLCLRWSDSVYECH